MIPRIFLMLFLVGLPTMAQVDQFDDGELDGWTVSDVLAEVGAPPAEISFPEGNVRLTSAPSPDPEALGPSRIGAFIDEPIYTDVTTLIDIVAWDAELAQDIGIIARGTTIGLGTTSGYALTLDVDEGAAYLSRLDSEVAATLATGPVVMEPGKTYRFRLTAVGNFISAGIANADIPNDELIILEAEDDIYDSGVSGFFNNSGVDDGTTDATYDRFVAFDPSGPSMRPAINAWTLDDAGMLSVDYSVAQSAGGGYVLESSADLLEWAVLATGGVDLGFTNGSFQATVERQANHYFRVAPSPPLFQESFEKGAEGWAATVATGDTVWELGTPNTPDITTAHGGTQAYGTLLESPYTDLANLALRSPLIDLTNKARGRLTFWYHVDVSEGKEGVQLNYVNEADQVVSTFDEILWTKTGGWTFFETPLPEAVFGQKVRLEWLFRSDNESPNGAGFFLDDVTVD